MPTSDRSFVDTNVLVYAFDDADPRKQKRAWEILTGAADGSLMISTQVLQEFYVVTTRKIARPLGEQDAEQAVHRLARWPVVQVDSMLIVLAIEISRRHQLSFWDALIVQAALESGCSRLLSEDLQAGASWSGLTVVNPFEI